MSSETVVPPSVGETVATPNVVDLTPEQKRELWRTFRYGRTPEERKQASLVMQARGAAAKKRARQERNAELRSVFERGLREFSASRFEAVTTLAARATRHLAGASAPAPQSPPFALTAADIPPARRRRLFDLALSVLEAQLQATRKEPVVEGGKVVGHQDVPDNNARLRAVAETLVLLGARTGASARADRASGSTRIEVKVADFAQTTTAPDGASARRPRVVDVAPEGEGPSGETEATTGEGS